MKKSTLKVLATAFLSHLATPSTAQVVAPASTPSPTTISSDVPFAVGSNVLNLGLGFGASWYSTSASATPAFSASYERGILALGPVTLGIGGYLGFQRATSGNAAFFSNGANNVVITARGALHYPAAHNLDLYGGLGLGMRNISLDKKSVFYETSNTDFIGSAVIGGRYYFTNSIGAFAELGYDQTYFKAGIALKF